MTPCFHFISGLPRSGSTLLAAILRQNPRFHASISSPVWSLYHNMLNTWGASSEIGRLVNLEQRRSLVRGLFDNYYAGQADKSVIFDTNRMWCGHMPALLDQFPNAKVIACVRDVAWIMDSIERLYRANPYEITRLFDNDTERNSVYSRVNTLSQLDRLVGCPWAALKEAYYGEHNASLLIVEYDHLAQAPQKVIASIYQFLGETPYSHDYHHLQFDTPEYDASLGLYGLHKVRPQVRLEPRNTILPPDLFEQFASQSFWKIK